MTLRFVITVLLAGVCIFFAGCSSVPEVLTVEGAYFGTYWEIIYTDGPCHIEGEYEDKSGDKDNLKAEVLVVGMRRRGWGAFFPWCWFGDTTSYQYSVTWKGERSFGDGNTHYCQPATGVLTDLRLTDKLLIGGVL